MPVLDGVASIAIGVLLAGIAVLLILEARGLVTGEGVRPETAARIRQIATGHDAVKGAAMPLTMYLGANEVLLAMDLEFVPGTSAARAATAVEDIERQIRAQHPHIRRIYLEGRNREPPPG